MAYWSIHPTLLGRESPQCAASPVDLAPRSFCAMPSLSALLYDSFSNPFLPFTPSPISPETRTCPECGSPHPTHGTSIPVLLEPFLWPLAGTMLICFHASPTPGQAFLPMAGQSLEPSCASWSESGSGNNHHRGRAESQDPHRFYPQVLGREWNHPRAKCAKLPGHHRALAPLITCDLPRRARVAPDSRWIGT